MDDLIVKFCENRRSWLVVIAGTLGLCLVLVLPEVDEYIADCAEKAEVTEKLARAKESAQLLGGLELRQAEQAAVVASRQAKTLHEENEADYRNEMVKLVRETGCQLRRLNIGAATARNWGQGDDPREKGYRKQLKPTGFQLERRQVALSLVGNTASVRRLIERFEQQEMQVHVEAMDLKPASSDGHRVELNMELWYYTLAREAA